MPKVSVVVLTKNRLHLLQLALASVDRQLYRDYELIVVDDASTDGTAEFLANYPCTVIRRQQSMGITANRQLALEQSRGEYVAMLDDDDEWIHEQKLSLQVSYMDSHPRCVLTGGAIQIIHGEVPVGTKFRPETDGHIRSRMLLLNPFFTSTVMFRRQAALKAGGFVADDIDLAEDYDLWLRLGIAGQLHNFQDIFTQYRQPGYNKEKFGLFLRKQLRLVERYGSHYPWGRISRLILGFRLFIKK